ncbi:hypothetical protein VTL71DRAFT_6326 [Oculimacula yallundae]|uniref:2EXR domain-containing protein n=1 Tax=Oculimacula yallundae TaxID=86028 RepID=A0ABR4BWN7_9HELO
MARLGDLLSVLPTLDITPPPPVLKSFTLFPKLPIELRCKIIAFAAHEPREVLLSYDPDFFNQRYLPRTLHLETKHYDFRIPPILFASSELRAEGLRYYTLLDCNYENHPRTLNKRNKEVVWYIYANFAVDHFNSKTPGWKPHCPGWNYGFDIKHCNFTIDMMSKVKFLDCQLNDDIRQIFPRLTPLTTAIEQFSKVIGTLAYLPRLQQMDIVALGNAPGDMGPDPRSWKPHHYIWRATHATDARKQFSDALKAHVAADPKLVLRLRDVHWGCTWIDELDMLDEDLYPMGDGMIATQNTMRSTESADQEL